MFLLFRTMDAAPQLPAARSPGEQHPDTKGYVQLHEARQQQSPVEVENIFTLLHKGSSPHRFRTRPEPVASAASPKAPVVVSSPVGRVGPPIQRGIQNSNTVAPPKLTEHRQRSSSLSPRALPRVPTKAPRKATSTRSRSPGPVQKAALVELEHNIENAMIDKLIEALTSATSSSLAKVSLDELVRIQHILKRHGYNLHPGTKSPLKVTKLGGPASKPSSAQPPVGLASSKAAPLLRIPLSTAAQPSTMRTTPTMLDAVLHGRTGLASKSTLRSTQHRGPARPGSSPGALSLPRAPSGWGGSRSPQHKRAADQRPTSSGNGPRQTAGKAAAAAGAQTHIQAAGSWGEAAPTPPAPPATSLAGLSLAQLQGYAAGFLDGRCQMKEMMQGVGAEACNALLAKLQLVRSSSVQGCLTASDNPGPGGRSNSKVGVSTPTPPHAY